MNGKRKKKITRYRKERKGSISVLLSIILLPCLTFTGLMVDYANIMMSKSVAESTGELAVNAALANYDTVLEDVYGLFAMSQNNEQLSQNLQKYFENTLSANGLLGKKSDFQSQAFASLQNDLKDFLGTVSSEDVNRNFLKVQTNNFQASGVSGSELSNPEIMKSQIVEFMKYRGPAEVGLDMVNSLNAFKAANEKSKVADKKMDVDEALDDLGKTSKAFYEALEEYDRLMDAFQKAENTFENSVGDLNNKMQESNEILVTKLYQAPDLAEIKYVESSNKEVEQEDGSKETVVCYVIPAAKSWENNYEKLLEKINNKMIEMQKNENKLLNKISRAANLSVEEKIEIYPVFAEYMKQARELSAMGVRLRDFNKSNYNLKKKSGESQADYETRVEAEPVNQAQVLTQIEGEGTGAANDPVMYKIYARIQSAYKAGYEDYKVQVKNAKDTLHDNMQSVSGSVENYYSAADLLLNSTRDKEGWELLKFWEGDETFLDCAIRLGGEVKKKLKNVDNKNNAFRSAVESYGSSQSQDEYYNIMKNEADRNSETFTEEDVEEILIQLRAGRNYISGDGGALKNIESWIFYGKNIRKREIDTGDKATNAAFGIFDSMGDSFNRSRVEEYYNTYFPVKFFTNKHNYHDGFFPKQMKEANVTVAGKTYHVPSFYLYLATTYGVKEEKDDEVKGKDLSKSTQKLNKQAKEESSKEDTKIKYEASVFDVLNTSNGTDGSTSKFEDVEDGNTGILKQFKNLTSTARNIFQALTGGLENARDNLLVTEYVFENFSFATFDKQEGFDANSPKFKTMTMQNINKNNNAIYGCEIEYILKGYRGSNGGGFWFFTGGSDGPEKNISMVKGDIFTIRFLMNSIYALTDGTIDAQTLPPAMAIQAATAGVFPYQVAQVVFKLCLALAESTLDLIALMDGKKVPLIKTSSTWTMSVQGMANKIKSKAGEVVIDKTTDVIKNMSDYLQQCVNNAGEWAAGTAENAVNQVAGDVKSTVNAALQEALSAMTQAAIDQIQISYTKIFSEGAAYSEAKLKQEISAKLSEYVAESDMSEEVKSYLNGQVGNVTNQIVQKVSGTMQKCSNNYTLAKGGTISLDPKLYTQLMNDAGNAAKECIESLVDGIAAQVNQMTSSLIGDITSEVNEVISTASEKAAKNVETKVNEFMNKHFPSSSVSMGSTTQKSSGKLANVFSFSYKDYLRLFVFLGLSGDEEQPIIHRISDVIELNIDSGLNDYYSETGIAKLGDFDMANAYTYVEVSTDIQVVPLLLSQEIFMRATGEKHTVNFWSYPYQNIAGY